MAPVTNKRIVFKEFLKGSFVPGQTTEFDGSQTIDMDNVPLNGGVLLKTLVLSLEPYVLAGMRPGLPLQERTIVSASFAGCFTHLKSFSHRVRGYGVDVVVRSEDPAFQVGDYLCGFYPFEEYSQEIDNKYNLPWSVFVGIARLPGHTAYFGWEEHSHAKKGEVAFVTSGAGGVGSLVIQLVKRDGLKGIASADSDDKIQFLKDLGADVAFNYKTTMTSEVLANGWPPALNAAAKHARFIECGMISGYSGNNLLNVVTREISFDGFVVSSLKPKYLEAFKEGVPALLASKELIYREDITRGLENAR
ncbi:NAD(P)-binding protein [Imleria badia]|nr:NAD(P)-binding protein [Imleria badia]